MILQGNWYYSNILCLQIIECVFLLLEKNAPVKVKNEAGWSPLAEAISWGSRSIGMKQTL